MFVGRLCQTPTIGGVSEKRPAISVSIENFTGARRGSAVNSLMIKRAVLLGIAFLGFYFSLAAQQTRQTGELRTDSATAEQSRDIAVFDPAFGLSLYRSEIPGAMDSSVLLPERPELTLLDEGDLLAELGIAPLDLFPVASSDLSPEQNVNVARVHRSARKDRETDRKDLPSEIVNLPWSPIYYGGEVGIFYGRWNGKYSGDILQTYILGDVGNEKFHIRVGAAYEESNLNAPRYRSFKGSK
jgi:hypothetical protein